MAEASGLQARARDGPRYSCGGRSRVACRRPGRTTTTLDSAAEHLAGVDAAPTPEALTELIADKGYHARNGLKALADGPWKNRFSEPKRDEFSRWKEGP